MTHNLTIENPAEVSELTELITKLSKDFQVFCFYGEMGVGKTTFIKAICAAFGVNPSEMSSPTFALVNEYKAQNGDAIYHFDLYRIEESSELFQIGWDDYLTSNNLIFIEWPEKAATLIPDDAVAIRIDHANDAKLRILEITTP